MATKQASHYGDSWVYSSGMAYGSCEYIPKVEREGHQTLAWESTSLPPAVSLAGRLREL